jgi:ribokinase
VLQHVTIELTEAQVEPCVRFYALLGFTRVEPPESLAGRATWVERGGTQVHLMPVEHPVVPPSGHHAVLVVDYDGTLAALRDAGFDPEPREEHWGAARSFVRNPAGHRVEGHGRLAGAPLMRPAVVGHVEWVEFARVARVPRQGEIAHVSHTFEAPAGGGAVAAVQLARLAGECTFYTALGDDALGQRTIEELTRLGVTVEAVIRPGKSTRRGFTYLDDDGERTITVIGERLGPSGDDAELPWDALADVDGVYFVAGDAAALRRARAARALVATSRIVDLLEEARVQLDAVFGSGADVSERYRPIDPPPRYVAVTDGRRGGAWTGGDGESGRWQAAPLPGPVADAYGAGDSFAAGLAYALGDGRDIDAALELAARCGATAMTGHGPYGRQLTRADL